MRRSCSARRPAARSFSIALPVAGLQSARRKLEARLVGHGGAELLQRLGRLLRRPLGHAALLRDLGVEGDGAVLVPRLLARLGGGELVVGGLLLPLQAVAHQRFGLVEPHQPSGVSLDAAELGAVRGRHQHQGGGRGRHLVLAAQLRIAGAGAGAGGRHGQGDAAAGGERELPRGQQLGEALLLHRVGEPVEDQGAVRLLPLRHRLPGDGVCLLRVQPGVVARRGGAREAPLAAAPAAAAGGEDGGREEEQREEGKAGEAERETSHRGKPVLSGAGGAVNREPTV